MKPASAFWFVMMKPTCAKWLGNTSRDRGYLVWEAENATAMRELLNVTHVDLIILDINMPGEDA